MKKAFNINCLLIVAALLMSASSARAQKSNPPVEALIYSTMPSSAAHRPEMAFDRDPTTYFSSAYGMEDGDDFLVILSRPVRVKSIKVLTGDPDHNDLVTEGMIETSPDSIKYSKAAEFDKTGTATVNLNRKPVMSVRIRLNHGKGLSRLVIREITIDSDVALSHVEYGPPRGFIDLAQAPDLAFWAEKAEKQMEAFWPDTAAILYSDGFITPNAVNVIYRTGPKVTPVAATGGGVMEVNSAYCRTHPDDTALTVHETAHVVQSIGSNAPGWLIEGTADYIRWVKFEPEHFHPRINVEKATYHDAYQTSATFLGWCALHYDSELVTKLNRVVRNGGYSNNLFVKFCGKDVNTLWSEFIAAYKADPTHIITPPVPSAMAPRTLPLVTPGTSIPIDLSSIFNLTGIVADGATFSASSGFDGEGTAFSATFVPKEVISHDVIFQVGPSGSSDVAEARRNTVSLPTGSHHSLWLLASAINGANHNQTITVSYTDGSTQSFAQNFSDWYLPENFPGEIRAVKTTYRDLADGSRDGRTFYLYSYGFPLDPTKTVKAVILPDAPDLHIVSMSLAD